MEERAAAPGRGWAEPRLAEDFAWGDFRLSFAYAEVVTRPLKIVSPSALRWELSQRNAVRAAGRVAEMSYSPVPSIVYGENEAGEHGNFLAASYRRILQRSGMEVTARQGLYRLAISSPGRQTARGANWSARTAQTRC